MKLKNRLLIYLVCGIILTLFSGFFIKVSKNFELKSEEVLLECRPEDSKWGEFGPLGEGYFEPPTSTNYGAPVAYVYVLNDPSCNVTPKDIDSVFFAMNVIFWSGFLMSGTELGYKISKGKKTNKKVEKK